MVRSFVYIYIKTQNHRGNISTPISRVQGSLWPTLTKASRLPRYCNGRSSSFLPLSFAESPRESKKVARRKLNDRKRELHEIPVLKMEVDKHAEDIASQMQTLRTVWFLVRYDLSPLWVLWRSLKDPQGFNLYHFATGAGNDIWAASGGSKFFSFNNSNDTLSVVFFKSN